MNPADCPGCQDAPHPGVCIIGRPIPPPQKAPPEYMVDETQTPIALLASAFPTRIQAVRHWLDKWAGLAEEWYPDLWDDETDRWRPTVGPLRRLMRDFKPTYMRPARDEGEWSPDFGEDTWLYCRAWEPGAVRYWELPG